MKKTITLLLASLVATTGILASCGKKKTDPSTSSSNSTTTTTSISTDEVTSAVTSHTTSNPSTTIPPDSFVEVGEYTITWINGIGSSYQLVDGGVLPGKANGNDKIEFKLALAYGFEVAPTVTANDVTLTPVDGVYSFVVTGNTTIQAADLDVNYDEVIEYSSYY